MNFLFTRNFFLYHMTMLMIFTTMCGGHKVKLYAVNFTALCLTLQVRSTPSDTKRIKMQPRPQGLLAFQYGGGSGEDPGT